MDVGVRPTKRQLSNAGKKLASNASTKKVKHNAAQTLGQASHK